MVGTHALWHIDPVRSLLSRAPHPSPNPHRPGPAKKWCWQNPAHPAHWTLSLSKLSLSTAQELCTEKAADHPVAPSIHWWCWATIMTVSSSKMLAPLQRETPVPGQTIIPHCPVLQFPLPHPTPQSSGNHSSASCPQPFAYSEDFLEIEAYNKYVAFCHWA